MHNHGGHRAGRPALLVLFTLVVLVLTACSSSSGTILSTVGAPVTDPNGGSRSAVDSGANGGPVPAASAGAPDGGQTVGLVDDAKIVRTGTMQLEVKDVGTAVDAARTAIRGLGGYIGASNTSNDGDRPVAEITYRIPVARWEDALAALRTLGGQTTKVVVESTQAVEVTGQIVDLDARIRNLRASETSLQAIAAAATKVSDVLEVQGQLTTVRGQIEELSAQRTDLGDRADYATLATTFRVPLVAVQQAQHGWEPGAIVDDAAANMISILQSVAGAGIWFAIVWLPILIVLAIAAVLLRWISRRTGLLRRARTILPPGPPDAPSGWVTPGG